MVLAPRLEIKQSQKLMMNPQMQQAIQLLQLTNAQLSDMLTREMEQNPFLAFDENHYRESQSRAVTVQGTSGVGLSDAVVAVRVDFTDTAHMLENTLVAPQSLSAHLMAQIGEELRQRDEAALAIELVGWLDENGYLRESDDEICATFHIDKAALEAVLARLRSFTPTGVFARNLVDCLSLQLAAQGALSPIYTGLLENFDLLGKGDIAGLAAAVGMMPDDLTPYLQTLRALDPHPAADFGAADVGVQTPDIIVLENATGWQAYLNEATLPSVLVLERDWEAMAARKITDDERDFMKANVQSARWLRKATQQRAATLLRVARAIIGRQQAFFEGGMVALQPMVLRDIADALELHESTVSRSASGKLVQTPKGVFHLKDLFSRALGGEHLGSNAKPTASAAIKAQLAQLIAAEDALTHALSDDMLVAALSEFGIDLARRTVAKYRKELGLGSSAQRRRAARIMAAAGGK